jgi:serine phosphatase RsbU (regulator of sigma subunit)/anti-sigma regulatory factor (Ser/Thr protein kinase)
MATMTRQAGIRRLFRGRFSGGSRRAAAHAVPDTLPSDAPEVDIAPTDPLLAYLQSSPRPVLVDHLKIDSPAVRALRSAEVAVLVPLVTHGELVAILSLGRRLSEQEYSADDRRLLENLARQAAPALRVAQLVREQEAEIRQRERHEQEMHVAQLIQQHFLPRELPSMPGWDVSAHYRPAREVGGDFYDFIDLPDGRLGIVVGDVTDKGVPAALVMASTRSVLRSSTQRLIEPAAVLERVNDMITPDMPPHMFATCLYGILDPDTGSFRFANAGHNLPCVQTDDGAVEISATGVPLGLLPGSTYDENEVVIPPGRTLLLYSDALPEAHAPDREMFGFPRLVEITGASGDAAIDTLLSELDAFTGPGWEQEDDITMVAIRRLEADATRETSSSSPSNRPDLVDHDELDCFTVPDDAIDERAAMRRVGTVVDDLGLEPARLDNLQTAVAEAVMNAVEHGNAGRQDLPVTVRVLASSRDVVVQVTDHGIGEPPPDLVTEPDLDAKLRGEQAPRGWGLFLMRALLDDLRVERTDAGQVASLVLNRTAAFTKGARS